MIANVEKTVIEISRTKLILSFFASLTFVVLSCFFINDPQRFLSPFIRSKELILIASILGIAIFGFFAIMLLKKIFDKGEGLIISKEGIYDNSTAMGVGMIDWEDIIGIKRY